MEVIRHTFDQATFTSKELLKRENIWLGKFSCESIQSYLSATH